MSDATEITTIQKDNSEITRSTPMTMIAAAVDKGMDAATISGLMDLQERWEANEAKKAFGDAMAAFKLDQPTVIRDKVVNYGQTSYAHASLDNASEVLGKALAIHGLKHGWSMSQGEGGGITVTCTLSHRQGHSEKVSLTAPPDDSGKKNSIQQIASTVTYLERYTLLAVTGTAVKDQDDDGVGFVSTEMLDDLIANIKATTTKAAAKEEWEKGVRVCRDNNDAAGASELRAALIAHGEHIDSVEKAEAAE